MDIPNILHEFTVGRFFTQADPVMVLVKKEYGAEPGSPVRQE